MLDEAELEARGLYDPQAPDAADRLALLRFLEEDGLTLDEMVAAHAVGRLTAAAGDRQLRPGEGRYTLAEAAERASVSLDMAERLRRAVGLTSLDASKRQMSDADVETLRAFNVAVQLFGERPALDLSRVVGSSIARIAESAVSLFLAQIENPLLQEGRGSLALARANRDATAAVNVLPTLIETLFRRHVEEAVRRQAKARDSDRSAVTVQMAVGFVDLVGFTLRTQQLSAAELTVLVREFEARAQDVVTMHGGRVVKLIGDEVMFVALDAGAGCEIALSLVEAFRDDASGIAPRGGLAAGPLLMHGGDYYGTTVNLASRIADLAVPFEILVTLDVMARAEKFRFEPAGRRILKGFAEPLQLYAARRLDAIA
jgi:adenylate cyclase